jgi:DNA-binding SARP family transcriptional activator
MAHLNIYLIGPLLITQGEKSVLEHAPEKARALLAFLAAEKELPHRREKLAEILWPGRPEGAARANLRHTLTDLNTALPDFKMPPVLLIARDFIQLNPEVSTWVDTAAFSSLMSRGMKPGRLDIGLLEQAAELLKGKFMQGFSIKDSAEFEEWLLMKRETFTRQALDILHQLADFYSRKSDYRCALGYARRQLELEPWDERAHRQVMRFLAASGQRGAALAQYDTCRSFLREELDVDPGKETNLLYEQIRDGNLEELMPAPALIGEPEIDLRPPAFLEGENDEAEPLRVVAREREFAELEDFLHHALNGSGRVVFVTGVAGQGKTALLNEFARCSITAHSNLLVALGNCYAYSGVGDPYTPFREVLAMLCGDVESQWSSGRISRKHAQRLWNALPKTIPTLLKRGDSLIDTFLAADDLFWRAVLSIPDHTKCLEQLRALTEQRPTAKIKIKQNFLFEHYTNFLLTLSEQYPLVIILDDYQWADSASIGLLFHLGRRLAKGNYRLLILCAYRPEEVALNRAGERHPLVKVLNEFVRIFGEDWVNLDQTEQRESRRFVDTLLDTEPNKLGEEFRSALFRRTQGHPLFTVELLRAMQDRNDIIKNKEGYWIEAPTLDWESLPARVLAVIAERIDRLSPELQQILNAASVEGEVFTAQIVAEVQKVAEKPLLGQLARELGSRHRLVREQGELETDQGRISRFRFSHILFQEYVYRQLSLGERRLLHRDVATAMEKVYQGQHDEMAVQLAHHFYQAGENNQAFEYSILAARQAARLYASDETVRHTTRAIEIAAKIVASRVALINLYRERGLAYETLGKFHHALADLETACQIAHAENEHCYECYALIDLGKLWASKDYNQSYHHFDQALILARQMDDPEILATSLNWMGNWYANAEKPNEAIRYHHEALELLKVSGNQLELARTLDLLGIASVLGADSVTSKAYFDLAVARFRELDDRLSLASSLLGRGNNGGATYLSLSVFPAIKPCESRRDFEEAIKIAHEVGSPAAEAWADWSLGLLEVSEGNFGAALEIVWNGFGIATDIGHLEWIVGCQAVLGVLYAELFALEEAQHHLVRALKMAEELRSQHWINRATGTIAAVYLMQKNLSQAQNALATVISPQTPMDTMHKRYCWARRAELALAQDDPGLAVEITNRLICSAPSLSPGRVITFLWKLKGEALVAMRQFEEASSLLCAAKENAQEYGERFLQWRIHASLGKLYRSMNNQTYAEIELSVARAMIEELAATLRDEKLKQNFLAYASSTLNSLS